MNSYDLSRSWFDWCFENPERINPNHSALYFFCIEHCNRLGWKEKFGLPTSMAKEAIGIRSYNTYKKTLDELVDFGFLTMIEISKNQHSSNIVALSNFNKAPIKADAKALDKALQKHSTKQVESTHQSSSSIDKQVTIEQFNKEQGTVLLKKETKFNITDFLEFQGADKKLATEWVQVRKLKKLANTQTAMDDFIHEVEKSNMNINDVLKKCIVKSWGGFKYSWLIKEAQEQAQIIPKKNHNIFVPGEKIQ
jgi:virulence-associated protein VapD